MMEHCFTRGLTKERLFGSSWGGTRSTSVEKDLGIEVV